MIVLPTLNVGARRLPVGPSIAATASSSGDPLSLNSLIFLPLIAISFLADFSISAASFACSFLLAGTVSLASRLCVPKNLATRVQVVQPLRL